MLADLILIGMHTGARIEEICSLLCKDINLEAESITIADGKTDAGNRVIPIHPYIKDLIKALIKSLQGIVGLISQLRSYRMVAVMQF
jgi:integrase